MAATKIADVIQPEIFSQYVLDETTEKSELITSGAIENNPILDSLVAGGGSVVTMPKWEDLTGSSQVVSDGSALTVNNISALSEKATMLIRGNAWGASELAGALAGDDPMKAIASRVANWWVRDEKKIVLSILAGIFGAATMSDLTLDVSAKNISGTAILDGKQLLGDNADYLSMIYVHSATFTELQKQNMIQFIPQSESKIEIPTFLGYRVIVDDSIPVDSSGTSKVFTTYLLARGCFQRGTGVPVSLTPVETDRDSLASTDILINRQAKVLHPKGLSWIGTSAGATPTNTELETGTNWKRVADVKKVGIVKILHKIGD